MASCFSIYLALWKAVLQVCLFSSLPVCWINGKPFIQKDGDPVLWFPVYMACQLCSNMASCFSIYLALWKAVLRDCLFSSFLVLWINGKPFIQKDGDPVLWFPVYTACQLCSNMASCFSIYLALWKAVLQVCLFSSLPVCWINREPFIQKDGDPALWFPVYMASHVTRKPGKQSSIDPFFLKYRLR